MEESQVKDPTFTKMVDILLWPIYSGRSLIRVQSVHGPCSNTEKRNGNVCVPGRAKEEKDYFGGKHIM